MKVILINTYPMDEAYRLWLERKYPGHHLWGFAELMANPAYECVILQHSKYKLLDKIGKLIKVPFLDQQLRAVWHLRKSDVLFAPYAAENTRLIIALKFLRIIRKRLVVLVHQPLFHFESGNVIKRFVARKLALQYSDIVFLSRKLKNDFTRNLKLSARSENDRLHHLDWGPDQKFYERNTPPNAGSFVISAGHTDRDFDTLIEAFRHIDFPLRIICTPRSYPTTKDIPAHVTISSHEKFLSYTELLQLYDRAAIIAIPIRTGVEGTQGLTSLLDVLGMGKPVVMTKNNCIDLDVEREKIGRYVNSSNPQEWSEIINSMLSDPDLLAEMSANSSRLMHETFNMTNFAKGLDNILAGKKTP